MLPIVSGISAVGGLGNVAASERALTSAGVELGEPNANASASQGAEGIESTGAPEGASGTPAVGAAEPSAAVGAAEGSTGAGASGEGGGSFGGALTSAISSLERTQNSASGAAQALATGRTANPESAVVTVEEARLEMQLAAQIRTKATEAIQGIFQTQV